MERGVRVRGFQERAALLVERRGEIAHVHGAQRAQLVQGLALVAEAVADAEAGAGAPRRTR